MDKRIILATAALLVLSLVPGVAAQSSTISGQILDQNGAPVGGVEVYLYQWGVSESSGSSTCDPDGTCTSEPYRESYHEAKAISDAEGRYSLPAMTGWASLNFYKEGYASHYEGFEVNGDKALDVKMLKYPAKTAQVTGTVTGAGAVLPYVSISAENPVYGIYECSVIAGEENLREHEIYADEEKPASNNDSKVASATIAPGEPYPAYQHCAITIQKDGTFSGMLTPGYTILRFYHQDWREQGGQEYYGKSFVRDLPANATTKLDVDLKARPMPNAVIQGYIVDAATKAAIPGVYVSFGNLDNYGWANAQTDKDGSYKVRMRAGVVQVSVYADGYLPWEGDVTVAADSTVRFDIHLTAGQAQYGGGCCIAYAESGDKATMGSASTQPALPASPGASSPAVGRGNDGSEASGSQFSDLGGGLGPYDASRAPQSGDADAGAPDVKDVPGFEVLALALGLLAVVLLRRK